MLALANAIFELFYPDLKQQAVFAFQLGRWLSGSTNIGPWQFQISIGVVKITSLSVNSVEILSTTACL